MATKQSISLENVGGLAFHIIALNLGPSDAASVSCLNKRFKDWASDDSLWSVFCSQELDLSSPIDPYGNPCPSFKVSLFDFSHFVIHSTFRSSNLLDFGFLVDGFDVMNDVVENEK